MKRRHKTNFATTANVGFIIWALFVLVFGVACLAGVLWLSHAFVEGVEDDCTKRCDGRDQDVASFTIFGCECKDRDGG